MAIMSNEKKRNLKNDFMSVIDGFPLLFGPSWMGVAVFAMATRFIIGSALKHDQNWNSY